MSDAQEFEPKYHLIEKALRSRVAAARVHDAVASETELCEEFGVSRMTARAALQRLVADGLVYRQVGRGTFVAPPTPPRRADTLVRFSAEMRRRGRKPTSRFLGGNIRAATDDEAAQLRLGSDAEVVAIARLRLADDVPVAIERAVFPDELRALLHADLGEADPDAAEPEAGPDGSGRRRSRAGRSTGDATARGRRAGRDVPGRAGGGSLHEALVRLGRVPASGHSTLDAQVASANDARLLQVPAGAALLVERRLILDRDDRPLELTESRYVGARYGLQVAFTVDP